MSDEHAGFKIKIAQTVSFNLVQTNGGSKI